MVLNRFLLAIVIAVRIGETVYVAGNPKGLEGTFSDGIISSRRDKEHERTTADDCADFSGEQWWACAKP